MALDFVHVNEKFYIARPHLRGESPPSSSFFLAKGTRPPYAGPGAVGSDPPARENIGFMSIGVTGVGAEVLIGVIIV